MTISAFPHQSDRPWLAENRCNFSELFSWPDMAIVMVVIGQIRLTIMKIGSVVKMEILNPDELRTNDIGQWLEGLVHMGLRVPMDKKGRKILGWAADIWQERSARMVSQLWSLILETMYEMVVKLRYMSLRDEAIGQFYTKSRDSRCYDCPAMNKPLNVNL